MADPINPPKEPRKGGCDPGPRTEPVIVPERYPVPIVLPEVSPMEPIEVPNWPAPVKAPANG
jgi:hypothetical protein